MEILVKGETLPTYATDEAAGADIRAHITEPWSLEPGETRAVPTGLFFEIPPGYEVQVRPRSGLAYKHGITVLNTPGTIDSDYRGEILVIMINHGNKPFVVEPGMRIAQVIVAPVLRARFVPVDELATTARGEGGLGHTGLI